MRARVLGGRASVGSCRKLRGAGTARGAVARPWAWASRSTGAAPDLGLWLGVQAPLRHGGKATARIRLGNGWLHLGTHDTALGAARAVDDALWVARQERPNWEACHGALEALDPARPVERRSGSVQRALEACAAHAACAEPRALRDPLRTRKKPPRPYVGVRCAGFCPGVGGLPIWSVRFCKVQCGRFGVAEDAAAVYDMLYEACNEGKAGPNGARSPAVAAARLARGSRLPDTARRLIARKEAGLPLQPHKAARVLAAEPGRVTSAKRARLQLSSAGAPGGGLGDADD